MDAGSLSVDVSVSEEDVMAFNAYLRRLPISRPAPRAFRRNLALMFALGAVCAAGFLSLRMQWGAWLMLGAFVAQPRVLALVARRNCAAAVPTFNGRLHIGESGVTMERPGSTTRLEPSGIVDITITDRHVFICSGFQRGWIIPFRCFEDAPAATRATSVLAALRQHVQAVSS